MIRVLQSVSNMDRAGIETMLMNYYRHMDRTLVQFDFLCNKKKPGAYDDEIIQMGGRIYRSPGFNPTKYFKYIEFIRQLKRENGYQVIHAHNGCFGVCALHAAWRCRIPARIYHAHGTRIPRDMKFLLKWFWKIQLPLYVTERWACSKLAGRFYYGRNVMEKGLYRLVPNAIELERFAYNPELRAHMRREHQLENKLVIGHVGRFSYEKNHMFILDVFAAIHSIRPDAVLVLLGDGELQPEVAQKCEALGLNDAVRIMGNVDNTDEWYQAFDVFMLPSLHEGLPVVGVEAQASGLPCVFSDVVTREESLTDKTAFISLSLSAEEWARQILKLLEGYERCDQTQTLREAGYDICVEAQKIQDAYLAIAASLRGEQKP